VSITNKPKAVAQRDQVDEALRRFETMPAEAYVRLPVVCALFSCSAPTVWRRVKAGGVPKPYKLSAGMTAWRVGELRAALSNVEKAA
jgi:predicted DNA-binding transcriptional regulator AlpA